MELGAEPFGGGGGREGGGETNKKQNRHLGVRRNATKSPQIQKTQKIWGLKK